MRNNSWVLLPSLDICYVLFIDILNHPANIISMYILYEQSERQRGGSGRRPQWKGRRRRLAAPTLNRPGTSDLESPVDLGLGPSINDLDPFTKVVSTNRGCQRPRWRGRGSRLAAPTLNLSKTSDSESSVDLGLGPPIGDPDPSSEVTSVLRGYRRPR
ncbi:hypothetical protein CRG98_006890 [Punica granatum]|uniref:Uncharacterized protein n=1 Tax=Punica granatum TaxID=22663 RepID=A0A2I0KW69_PUNGR|nr:hypothetical protein CRG98_006890 [Punica granatum]